MQITLGQNQSYQLAEASDAIAISLSENTTTLNPATDLYPSWQLDVYAQTKEGRHYLGTLDTVAGVNSRFPARVIGYAACPGARAWSIEATGPGAAPNTENPGPAFAELRAMALKHCASAFGLGLGLFRPLGRTIINGNIGTETGGDSTAPLVASRVDFTAPIAFSGAFGSNETASTIWIMFFDASAVPANGTQPVHGLSFNVPAGASFNFVAPQNGIFFRNGLTWVASSTPNTLTAVGAGAVARVVTLAQW